jgi:hypothetical protein
MPSRTQDPPQKSQVKTTQHQHAAKTKWCHQSSCSEVGRGAFHHRLLDPAKHRSAWMMDDYFGNVLIEPQVLQHLGAGFNLAVEQIHQVQQKHDIQDLIVVVERTGNY